MTPDTATIPLTHFQTPGGILLIGLITGLTYGLLAVGIALIYKVSRVISFAQGALGTLPAVLLPVLVYKSGLGYWPAMLVALVAGFAAGFLVEVGVIHRLRDASRLVVMVATIAIAQVLDVVVILLPHDPAYLSHTYPTPFHASATIGGVTLNAGDFLIVIVAPLAVAGLALFLRASSLGLGARAAADNPHAAALTGVPVARVSAAIWALGGGFAALSAILVGGTQSLGASSSSLGPSLLLRGLAAAMVGGLDSLPLVLASGVVIGVVESLIQWNYPSSQLLSPLLFCAIVASLLLRTKLGSVARGDGAAAWAAASSARPLPASSAAYALVQRARWPALVAGIGVAVVAARTLSDSHDVLLSTVIVFALMGLSLVVLTGYAGQVSLGQYAFVAFGAIVGGRMEQLGFPSGSALGYTIVGCALLAGLVGLPALRVRGLFLAVATLAFALAADTWLFNRQWLLPDTSGIGARSASELSRPHWFGIDFEPESRYAVLCLAVLVLCAAIVYRLRRSGLGRAMTAVRDNEAAAASLSVSPRRVKLLAFVVSGVLAGVAGYFYGGLLVDFSAAIRPAPVEVSLSLVVMVILGGVGNVSGALLGAAWVVGIPYAFGSNAGLLSSGLGVLAVLLVWPSGLAGAVLAFRDFVLRRVLRASFAEAARPVELRARRGREHESSSSADVVLAARDVTVSYGGNLVLDRVSLEVARGEVVGLLGPNGAGKTTLFDVLSGHQRPTRGSVELLGYDVTPLRPEERAQLGLARTFQQTLLFRDLTVLEAVQLGLEREEPSEVVPTLLALPPSWRAESRKRYAAREITELMGLGAHASRRLSELSTGTRRIADLACVVALGAEVILLDEPTAGIAQAEVEQFAPVIERIRDELAATVVIVEHDVPLLMSMTDRICVLSAGSVIADAKPESVRRDPAVIAAYLGTDDRAVARSGLSLASVGGR